MYEICPKCNYKRQDSDDCSMDQCPACGILFSKWMKRQFGQDSSPLPAHPGNDTSILVRLKDVLLYVDPDTGPVRFYGNLCIYVFFLAWGWQFIKMDYSINPYEIADSFMHNINLVFHEAGHVVFRPFGRFMMILGGSLMQLLVPAVVLLSFIFKNRDNFAASIGLWWLGQSLVDLAPYIDDAMEQKLVLLGGRTGADSPGSHDWNNILIEFNVLERYHEYARFADLLGTAIILLALAWGAVILVKQYKHQY